MYVFFISIYFVFGNQNLTFSIFYLSYFVIDSNNPSYFDYIKQRLHQISTPNIQQKESRFSNIMIESIEQ